MSCGCEVRARIDASDNTKNQTNSDDDLSEPQVIGSDKGHASGIDIADNSRKKAIGDK